MRAKQKIGPCPDCEHYHTISTKSKDEVNLVNEEVNVVHQEVV